MERTLTLPNFLQGRAERAAAAFLSPSNSRPFDFSQPPGAPALAAPTSMSWRIFKNPVALFIGGVTSVVLELAEPRVRSGVWNHSGFRTDPARRLKRTGLAAMVTVYGPKASAEAMIAGVRTMHGRVRGITPAGEEYRASDPELLTWVHATASFGFLEAYHRYVEALTPSDRDRFYGEGCRSALLYGAERAATSSADMQAIIDRMLPRLEPSPIVFEFLDIMRHAKVLPPVLRPLQGVLLRAAIENVPPQVRAILGLDAKHGANAWQTALVGRMARLADRVVLRTSPAVQASVRVGLPADYLYRR